MSALNCLVNEYHYDVGCLAPAILIIAVLSFMRKRVRIKPGLLDGRPGLPVAVDFLGHEQNRFIIPFAFGATAASAFNMFIDVSAASRDLQRSPWAKAFQSVLMSLLYGILNYPYIACLNAEYKIVGYAMGLLYSLVRIIVLLVLYFGCTLDKQSEKYFKQANIEYILYWESLTNIPVVVCTFILIGSYSRLLFKEIKKRNAQGLASFRYMLQKLSLTDHQKYSNTELMNLQAFHKRRPNPNERWYTSLKNRIYVSRPDFKFSTQFLSSFVVSCIFTYQLTVRLLLSWQAEKNLMKAFSAKKAVNAVLLLLHDYYIASLMLACLFAILQLSFFLRGHRKDVLKAYTTRKGLLPDETFRPKMLVGKSLRFCGYQVAFTAVGLLINVISVVFLLLPIYLLHLSIHLKYLTIDEVLVLIKKFILRILPYIVSPILVWISLILLSIFVFKDHTYPDISITINNRRLFGIMSYFFFFFNVLVGLWTGFFRIVKGAVLGLVFLPRIDRCSMMKGYRRFDSAYMAYIGFLNVLVAFRHPVMLCFCQMLLEGVRRRRETGHTTVAGIPRGSNKALNRWFLAVLLMRNPSLVRNRKQGIRPAVNPLTSVVKIKMPPIGLEKEFPRAELFKS